LIPVKLQPEPFNFYETVQCKGEAFLKNNPDAKGSKLAPYWRDIIPELREAYSGICAYTCHKIHCGTGSNSVDHFKSKDSYPQDAYKWENYRLVCGTMNGRKGKYEDVLDPFTLQEGWFELRFPSLQVTPNKNIEKEAKIRVETTIKRLKLNDYICIGGRKERLQPYLNAIYPFSYLRELAPFLASELKRQNLQDIHLPIWDTFKRQKQEVNL
jgi:hypothetical protein